MLNKQNKALRTLFYPKHKYKVTETAHSQLGTLVGEKSFLKKHKFTPAKVRL